MFAFFSSSRDHRDLHSFPTRRSSDLIPRSCISTNRPLAWTSWPSIARSEEHTSELQSRFDIVCRLLLEKKNQPREPRYEPQEYRSPRGRNADVVAPAAVMRVRQRRRE